MSYRASNQAVHCRAGSPIAKAVLLVLAEAAGDDGTCWLSQATIAERAECSLRAVYSAMASLAQAHLIERRRRNDARGHRTSDLITLTVHQPACDAARGERELAPRTDEPTGPACKAYPHVIQRLPARGAKEPVTEPVNDSPTRRGRGRQRQLVGSSLDVAGEARFGRFWDNWPEFDRPRNRALAAKLFSGLSPEEQRMAVDFAHVYRATRGSAGGFAPMLPYLRERLFAEFVGAPEIDGGHFVITLDRPEWASWLAHFRAHHSASVVERQAAKGRFLTPTRWPPKTAETASSVPPDTAGQASPPEAPSPHNSRTASGGSR